MKGLEALDERLKDFATRVAKVGWFESARYEDDGISVAEVAIIQEFGAPAAHIPPRPFFRPTIDQNKGAWSEKIAQGARQVLKGNMSADDVLEAVGQLARGQLQQTISEVRSPPLAPRTIAQRMREGRTDQPLNRTGHMIATVSSVVGDKE